MNYGGLTESSHPRQDNSYCCQLRADPIARLGYRARVQAQHSTVAPMPLSNHPVRVPWENRRWATDVAATAPTMPTLMASPMLPPGPVAEVKTRVKIPIALPISKAQAI